MNPTKRSQICKVLRDLAAAHSATMQIFETAIVLLTDELALDPIAFWNRTLPRESSYKSGDPKADFGLLSIVFQGRSCFLGNTLAFRLFARLLRTPNAFITYEDLLADVWGGVRTDSAIRSIVKSLRAKLRQAGMDELADSIDGSEAGRYSLRLRR